MVPEISVTGKVAGSGITGGSGVTGGVACGHAVSKNVSIARAVKGTDRFINSLKRVKITQPDSHPCRLSS